MKLTKQELKQIIKEEVRKVLQERPPDPVPARPWSEPADVQIGALRKAGDEIAAHPAKVLDRGTAKVEEMVGEIKGLMRGCRCSCSNSQIQKLDKSLEDIIKKAMVPPALTKTTGAAADDAVPLPGVSGQRTEL